MKTKLIKHIGLLVSAALSFSAVSVLGLAIAESQTPAQQLKAASDYGTYYSSVSGTGTDLLNSTYETVKNLTNVSYGGLWDLYNSCYTRSDGKMYDVYSDTTNFIPTTNKCGSYSSVGDCYNREHSIPKSWWGSAESAQGSDGFIVIPSDGKINGERSNFPYGITANGTVWKHSNDTYSNRKGTSTETSFVSGTVFEPFDNRKGDIARIYFYAVACYYKQESGSKNLGSPDKWVSGEGSSVFGSGSGYTNCFKDSYLQMLLKWHHDDPVSDWEKTFNSKIQSVQKNRNPFIDHPSWVDLIWNNNNNSSFRWSNYSYPSSGANYENTNNCSATVKNGEISAGTDPIANITGNSSVVIGNNITLTASLQNVTDASKITWSSSATSKATVSKGTTSTTSSVATVTGVAAGSATIYCKYNDVTIGSKEITITSAPVPTISVSASSSSIAVNGTSTLTATTENAGTPTITWSVTSGSSYVTLSSTSGSSITVTGEAAGSATIKASMTVSGTTYSDSVDITVSSSGGNATLYSGSITEGDYVIVYSNNAMKNTISSNRLSYKEVTITSNIITSPESDIVWHIAPSGNYWTIYNTSEAKYAAGNGTKNQAALIASGTGDYAKWTVTGTSTYEFVNKGNSDSSVNANLRNNGTYGFACYSTGTGGALSLYKLASAPAEKTLTSISLDTTNVQTSFIKNSTFNYTGLVVTANYSDGSDATVTPTSVSSPSMTTGGQKTVTVTYTEKDVTKDNSYSIYVISSISASVSKTYIVGETITASDITVKDNFDNELSGFTFSDYQFVYKDAASGGTLTNKTFTNGVTYETLSCSLTVQVQRQAHSSVVSVTDTITAADLPATGTTYTDFSNIAKSSNARYAGNSAKDGSDNIQMRSKNSNSGIVSTTSGGMITSVTINVGSGSNTIKVYGKNSAYTAASDLYNSSSQGTLIGSTSSTGTITFTGSYQYVGIRSDNGAIYISSIEITYGGCETPTNVANYIMYEDTNGQCETKFDVAKGYFESMSAADRATFMTSTDYVVSQGRERLIDWAKHHGKSIVNNNGDYVISGTGYFTPGMFSISESNYIAIIIIITTISVASIGGYLALRRRKEQ